MLGNLNRKAHEKRSSEVYQRFLFKEIKKGQEIFNKLQEKKKLQKEGVKR